MTKLREEVSELMADNSRPTTRRAFARVATIHQMIDSGKRPTCVEIGKALEVTPKTIQRDINFMRDTLKLPLEYDGRNHGWVYTAAVIDFPKFEVGAEELAAVFLARAASDSLQGTVLGDKLRETFAKLTRSMTDRIQLNWSDIDEAFSRKSVDLKSRDVMAFGRLAEAVVKQRQVKFHYRKLTADKPEIRHVWPLHLGEVDGAWYLIGRDVDRRALRTFALPRMTRLKTDGQTFERPSGFDGREYLRRSFGVWTVAGDDTLQLVQVRLKGYAARLAEERRWHPTQEIERIEDDGSEVEIRFEAGALEEVLRWVLSFGSMAKVISPPKLKKMVREEIRLMKV